jgi:hypothetical protein
VPSLSYPSILLHVCFCDMMTCPPSPSRMCEKSPYLGELLLDEEGAEVRELPCACDAKNDELDEDPANDSSVRGLGLISELGLSLSLKDLLLADVD